MPKFTQKFKEKIASKLEAKFSPIITRIVHASHQVAINNGCKLTCEEFAIQVRDILKEGAE